MNRSPKTDPNRQHQAIPEGADRDARFRRWFADSKVVDAQGQPLIVYHGGAAVTEFRAYTWWTPSRSAAESYRQTKLGEGGAVTAAYLSIQHPARREDILAAAQAAGVPSHDDAFMLVSPVYADDRHQRVLAELERRGHDGVHLDDDYSFEGRGDQEIESWMVMRASQIQTVPGP